MKTEESSSLLSSTEVLSPSSVIRSVKNEEKEKELEEDDDMKDNDDEENHQWLEFFENITNSNNFDDEDEGNDDDDDRNEGAIAGKSSSSIPIKTEEEEEVPDSIPSKSSVIEMEEEEVDEEVFTSIRNNTLVWGDGTITGGVAACEESVPRIERLWSKMYQNLIAYKKQHQTTSVPSRYKEGQNLGNWVFTQRKCYKKKEMSIERINYLESIGFVWKIREHVPWIEMYERLVAYKQHNQSTQVPALYAEDPSLGHWVHQHRKKYKNDKLSARQMQLLNSIGFVWSARK